MRDYEYSDLYFDAHLDKQMRIEVLGTGITIDNSMIELDAFELDEILCSEQELTFGSCEANCVKFTARDMPGSIVGKTIRITETVAGNTDAPFPYGVYKVYSDVPTSDRTKREITAYDAMYDIVNDNVKSWYAGLSFPMTLRQFRDSFFSHFGITQKEATLVNDGMTVNKTLVAEQTDPDSTITEESAISGKTVIEAICEINGVFGNINRHGEFEYIELKEIIDPLYPEDDLYPSDDLFPRDPNTISMTGHYITFDYEDFQTKHITQLEIRTSDDSAGAAAGTSGNNYVISGNFLVSDKTGTELLQIAANTLSIIRKAAYTPLKSSEVVGNPCIELGDPIRFNTTREIVESYVLQRTLTGIQNKRDSIVSPGTETYNQNPNGIKGQIANMQRRTNKLERTADHTLSELSDLDKNTSSRFEQTAEQIQMEVSNRQNADNEMSTKISQTAHSISLSASGGEKTVGITIRLYDENGNLLSEQTDNANITITGVVSFQDLANAGATVINGANISTGIIKSSDSEFTRAKFYEGIYYALEYNGVEYKYPLFVVNEPGYVEYGVDYMHTNFHGSCLFNDSRIYIGSSDSANKIATIGDIPNMSSYLKKDSNGNVAATGTFSGVLYATDKKSTTSSANAFFNTSTGHIGYSTASSKRYKHDISKVVSQELDPHKLYGLGVWEYIYNLDYLSDVSDQRYNRKVIGLIAEDVDEHYPAACDYNDDGQVENWNERYIIPPMLALIQEQHDDIESLKQENLALQNRLSILEQKMEELENVINNKINQS